MDIKKINRDEFEKFSYNGIDSAKDLFTWRENIESKYKSYGRMIHRGECSLWSYERDFYFLMIYILPDFHNKDKFSVRIWYNTIDDGDFGGWLHNLPLKDAEWILEEVKKVYSKIFSLPSDDEMNEKLKHLGIKVEHE